MPAINTAAFTRPVGRKHSSSARFEPPYAGPTPTCRPSLPAPNLHENCAKRGGTSGRRCLLFRQCDAHGMTPAPSVRPTFAQRWLLGRRRPVPWLTVRDPRGGATTISVTFPLLPVPKWESVQKSDTFCGSPRIWGSFPQHNILNILPL